MGMFTKTCVPERSLTHCGRCTDPILCVQGRPRNIHGLPYDGCAAGEGSCLSPSLQAMSDLRPQWVDDIADAGGALYCFHIEATCGCNPDTALRYVHRQMSQ